MLRNSNGFTLIELLTVTVILGLLAVIALPRFTNSREKAHRATMQSDLRNLATAQESFFADSLKYTGNLNDLEFRQSQNVTIDLPEANDNAWRAVATHSNAPGITCEIYFGSSTSPTTAEEEGLVACDG